MSDPDANAQAELITRKSSRQKTPNTYYQQDISEIKGGESKPKLPKQPVIKVYKPKRKPEKQTSKQPSSSLLSSIKSFIQPTQRVRKQSYSQEDEGSNQEEVSEKKQEMDVESNSRSNVEAPQNFQGSGSLSGAESKKSDQNNINSSSSENEENSNKAVGGYKTRKIRKKPKFADENYIDNMPPPKAIPQKKQKNPKQELSTKRSIKKPISIQLQDLNSFSPSIERLQGKNQKGQNKVQPRKDSIGINGDKKRETNPKKEEPHDFLNGGLLGLFLDTVDQVNQQELIPAESEKKLKDNSLQNAQLTNQALLPDFLASAKESSHTLQSNNQVKKSKKEGDEDSRKRLSQLEDASTIRKKIKPSSRIMKTDEDANSSQLELFKANQLQSNTQLQKNLIARNGTVYHFPDLNPKKDYITHVEKKTDKLILHHSTSDAMELKCLNIKQEIKQKDEVKKLISQINERLKQSTQKQLKENKNLIQMKHEQYLQEEQRKNNVIQQAQELLSPSQGITQILKTFIDSSSQAINSKQDSKLKNGDETQHQLEEENKQMEQEVEDAEEQGDDEDDSVAKKQNLLQQQLLKLEKLAVELNITSLNSTDALNPIQILLNGIKNKLFTENSVINSNQFSQINLLSHALQQKQQQLLQQQQHQPEENNQSKDNPSNSPLLQGGKQQESSVIEEEAQQLINLKVNQEKNEHIPAVSEDQIKDEKKESMEKESDLINKSDKDNLIQDLNVLQQVQRDSKRKESSEVIQQTEEGEEKEATLTTQKLELKTS